MPRSLSTNALTAISRENTSQVFLIILDISHPSLTDPIRVVNNFQDIVSGGHTYIAFPFEIGLPPEADRPGQVELTIDNVDRSIIQVLRGLSSPPTVTLRVILAATPDTIEAGPMFLTMRNIEYDLSTIKATLMYEDILNSKYPYQTFSPATHPGLFSP